MVVTSYHHNQFGQWQWHEIGYSFILNLTRQVKPWLLSS
jgi:hypothetical protein